jgi:hypothetical protein
MCDSNDSGSYYDNWEKVLWTECYDENNKLVKYAWKDSIINIPFNVEKKLIGRYGQTWKIPQKTKGPVPRKKIL